MAGNIFINYRRDESGHVAGRLHDSLAPTFGRNKLFMDVDNIPVGRDFEEYLKSQVAACDAMLAVIGPNWLAAKDETGKRRLDNPDDFIVIEIGAALARNIPVVPVLVDGARMPKASELPESLKPLVRRQAVEVRHANFSRDAEALVKRLRGALGYDSFGRRRRSMAAALAAMVMLLLAGWAGYKFMPFTKSDIGFTSIQSTTTSNKDGLIIEETHVTTRRADEEEKRTAAEVKRKVDEALGSGAMGDPRHITTLTLRTPTDAGQERQARPAFEPEAKRKAEEADRQRQVNIQAEQERRAKAEAEVKEKTEPGACIALLGFYFTRRNSL